MSFIARGTDMAEHDMAERRGARLTAAVRGTVQLVRAYTRTRQSLATPVLPTCALSLWEILELGR